MTDSLTVYNEYFCVFLCKCACVCSYVSSRCMLVFVHMCIGVWGTHQCVCVCMNIESRGPLQLSFLWRLLPSYLRQWLSLAWNSLVGLGRMAGSPVSAILCSPSTGIMIIPSSLDYHLDSVDQTQILVFSRQVLY